MRFSLASRIKAYFRKRNLERLAKLKTALDVKLHEVEMDRSSCYRKGDAPGFIESTIQLSMLSRQVSLVESRINDIEFSAVISNYGSEYKGAGR